MGQAEVAQQVAATDNHRSTLAQSSTNGTKKTNNKNNVQPFIKKIRGIRPIRLLRVKVTSVLHDPDQRRKRLEGSISWKKYKFKILFYRPGFWEPI
jgi:hypothetical protein